MWTSPCFTCPPVGDVPQSLPSFLVARCGNPTSWIYSDQKCDGINNCGDCSDELSPGKGLGTGRAGAGDQAVAKGQKLTRESQRFSLLPLLTYHEVLHPCLNASSGGVLTTTPGGSCWSRLFFCGGELTLKGTDEETGAQRVVTQRVRTWLNWDVNPSFLHPLCTSQKPCEEAA